MAYNVNRICKEYGGLDEYLEEDEEDGFFSISFDVTPEEARRAKTSMGKNYNKGTLPDPYMQSDERWKGWFMLGVIIAYVLVVIC